MLSNRGRFTAFLRRTVISFLLDHRFAAFGYRPRNIKVFQITGGTENSGNHLLFLFSLLDGVAFLDQIPMGGSFLFQKYHCVCSDMVFLFCMTGNAVVYSCSPIATLKLLSFKYLPPCFTEFPICSLSLKTVVLDEIPVSGLGMPISDSLPSDPTPAFQFSSIVFKLMAQIAAY